MYTCFVSDCALLVPTFVLFYLIPYGHSSSFTFASYLFSVLALIPTFLLFVISLASREMCLIAELEIRGDGDDTLAVNGS